MCHLLEPVYQLLLSEMLRIEGVTPILDVCVYNTWPVIQADSQERFLRTHLSWWECSSLFINVGHFLKVIGHPSYCEKKNHCSEFSSCLLEFLFVLRIVILEYSFIIIFFNLRKTLTSGSLRSLFFLCLSFLASSFYA